MHLSQCLESSAVLPLQPFQAIKGRGVMKDDAMNSTSSTRFSYGSTEIFHFHGVSAFSVWVTQPMIERLTAKISKYYS